MGEILLSSESLFGTDDRFIVDNMLTEEDLDLDPEFWAELSSNDSNSDDLSKGQMSPTIGPMVGCTQYISGPETPPSSDRSTPPNFDDLSHNILTTTQTSNTLPNVTIFPAMNFCPMSPLSPILTNPTPILTIKTQNEFNLINSQINNCLVNKTNAKTVDKNLNDYQLRREARKIRNRESASMSRNKKKEYVQNLENRVDGLLKENADLKNENQRLKCKLFDLENESKLLFGKRNYNSIETVCQCRTFVSTGGKSNKKAALSLLAVVFMLGLNLAPFSGVLISSNDDSISGIDTNIRRSSQQKHGTSRTLLWNTNDNTVDVDVIAFNSSRFQNESNSDINCKTYFNQTESLRLETDLRDWLSKVKLEKEEVVKYKRQMKAQNNQQLKDRFNKPIPLTRLKAWIQKRTETDFNEFNDYAIESYKTGLRIPQINYEDLLSAIHRRDDTFYLLSYSSKDHLIIPPMSRNSSDVRPRFSLLIPLISTLNESIIRGTNVTYSQMSVMQIDCQVINTKMVLFNTSPKSRTDNNADISSVQNKSNLRSKFKNKTSIVKNVKKRSGVQ